MGEALRTNGDEPGGATASRAGRRRPLLSLLPLLIVLGVLGAVVLSGAWRHLSLGELAARRAALKGFVGAHPGESLLIYVLAYCAVVTLSIPGALVMTLTGGVLFGTWLGGGAAALGVAAGATLMFLAAHTALGAVVRRFAPPGGLVERIEAGVRRNAFTYLLFLRLMPAAPIFLVNLAAALVRIPLWLYASTTLIGIAPSCFIYAAIGEDLNRVLDAGGRADLSQVLRPGVFAALFGLALLALSPIAYQAWRRRRG